MKLCKDCKLTKNTIDYDCVQTDICAHHNLHRIDYVYGGKIPYSKPCQDCRYDEDLCGKSAKWFEEKT